MSSVTVHESEQVSVGAFSPKSLVTSLPTALVKLNPRRMIRTPVMFVVLVGSVVTTIAAVLQPTVFAWSIAVWLWLTVIFANLADAVAEGRGKAQAASLRAAKKDSVAKRLEADGSITTIAGVDLHVGDNVVCEAGDVIPGDGDIIEGLASIDESAITGESAPVIRESGGDRCAVTGGTKVLSDRIVISITAEPGSTFIDRMIALVEGTDRRKTPNEIALNILLASLTIVFLIAVAALSPLANYSEAPQTLIVMSALLVCLVERWRQRETSRRCFSTRLERSPLEIGKRTNWCQRRASKFLSWRMRLNLRALPTPRPKADPLSCFARSSLVCAHRRSVSSMMPSGSDSRRRHV